MTEQVKEIQKNLSFYLNSSCKIGGIGTLCQCYHHIVTCFTDGDRYFTGQPQQESSIVNQNKVGKIEETNQKNNSWQHCFCHIEKHWFYRPLSTNHQQAWLGTQSFFRSPSPMPTLHYIELSSGSIIHRISQAQYYPNIHLNYSLGLLKISVAEVFFRI